MSKGGKVRIGLKRVYEPPAAADGLRVLVDRLWPRGLTKDRARVDLWPKEIAPSAGLREWFGHDPARWREFRERYRLELRQRPELVERLREASRSGPVTLLFAARDAARNNAVVLREVLAAGRTM